MSKDDPEPTRWAGEVQLWSDERRLGVLHVELARTSDRGRHQQWSGRVRGSDYLVWGANFKKSEIEFSWGERAEVVLRSGGQIQGLGPVPSPLDRDGAP